MKLRKHFNCTVTHIRYEYLNVAAAAAVSFSTSSFLGPLADTVQFTQSSKGFSSLKS